MLPWIKREDGPFGKLGTNTGTNTGWVNMFEKKC